MFYGPPGTGKSSLAMALAGHFKLDIHVLSLLDKNMNDHSLNRLMKSMSGKPLVLIEDIDSCGIGRDFEDDDDSDDESDDGWRRPKQTRSHVTLSGLLNAIDGVGAPEGHVLIMSTNHIEKMDEALVRAGRVDIKVKLDWCSRTQTRDIFMRMYSQSYKPKAASAEGQHNFSQAAMEEMAVKFSEQIPEFQISPAELQDFILMRKSSPLKALDEIAEWARKMIQERKDAEEEAEKKRNKKNKKKNGEGESASDDSGDGSRTPPPTFEEVTASKESWIRWLKKAILVEYSS
jgi:mitochondrial chaperone BCS1